MLKSRSAIDPKRFRQVLGQYPTGVCVITATEGDGRPIGMVVGSFTSVSLDPPLVAFFPDRDSGSWARLKDCDHFCVNVLSADQEAVCRKLASKDPGKYAEMRYRNSPLGSPIIDDVVAWIDCTLHRVDEAGDHLIVLGLVSDLEIAGDSLPLLFFQGGYGRFAPSSLMARDTHGLLSEQLRIVDCARPEMEHIAAELSAQCIASSRVGDELIFVATAGEPSRQAPIVPVGQRVPFSPPLGAVFAAWLSTEEVDRWIGAGAAADLREAYHSALAVVRKRGFAVGLPGRDVHRTFSARIRSRADAPEIDRDSFQSLTRDLVFDPDEMAADPGKELVMISAPIFSADGQVLVSLTVQGLPYPTSAEEARARVARLLQGAKQITAALAGY